MTADSPPEHHADGATVLRFMRIALHALFVALLVLGAERSAQSARHPLLCVVGAAILLAWYGVGILAARTRRQSLGVAWLLVLVAIWLLLLWQSPEFSWVAFPLWFLALVLLPRSAALAVVALCTAATIAAQLHAPQTNSAGAVIGPFIGAVVAIGISWIYAGLRADSAARQRLVDELVATQDAVAQAQRESGILLERSRLARDIHDTLAQSFSSILLLSRAGLGGAPDAERLRALLTRIEQMAAGGLDDARTVVRALAPDELEQTPLPAAFQRLLDRLTDHTGLSATLVVEGDARPLPTAVEVALLRLAQGALANVQQHARARQVTVTATYQHDSVQLDVVDDGIGFEVATRPPAHGGGFGLRAMRERMADIGGTLTIESQPGDGTAVSVDIPLRAEA